MTRDPWTPRYPGDHPVIEALSSAGAHLGAAASQLETAGSLVDAEEFHAGLDDLFLRLNDLDIHLDRQAGAPGPLEDRARPRPRQAPVRVFQPTIVVRELCFAVAHVLSANIRTRTQARMTPPQIEQAKMLAKDLRDDATSLRSKVPSIEGPLSREARIATGLSLHAKERADNLDAHYLAEHGEPMPDAMRAAVIYAISTPDEATEIDYAQLVYSIADAFDGELRTFISRTPKQAGSLIYHWSPVHGRWMIVRVKHVLAPSEEISPKLWICSFEVEAKGEVIKPRKGKKKVAEKETVSQ